MSNSTPKGASIHGMSIRIVRDIRVLREDWLALQNEQTCTIYQDYDWVRTAFESFETDCEPVIVHATRDGVTQFILPLALEKKFTSILRWPGANHANIGQALYARSFLESCEAGVMREVLGAVARELPSPMLLWLKNQPEQIAGHRNPLLHLPHQTGPNPLFPMDISVGLDDILDQGSGKRKRKLFRHQCRVAEKLGGHELVVPKTEDEINAVVDRFFSLKNERLNELGVRDVFAPKSASRFLRDLALVPETNGVQPMRLFVLNVGGEMRALYGCGVMGKHCHAFINAVVYDDFADESPGEMIMYLMIERLIEDGFDYFDIGIGRERYKFSWCKTPADLHETVYPMGALAMPYAGAIRFTTETKARIKANPFLWDKVKRLRKLRGRVQGH